MAKDLLELAQELNHGGEAFALATVVWRRAPSSGKVGYKALVTSGGAVSGWVAGACTEPLVVRQAMKAMKDGEPRLMLIGAPEDLETRSRDGLLTFLTSCQSEGALEIYVEPHLPSPQLVVVGRSPVVDTLAVFANALGWRTTVIDDEGGSVSDHGAAENVLNTLDLQKAGVGGQSYVVVATLGHYDEDALEAALKTGAPYIGLVASRKRAQSVMDYLRDNGVSQEDLGRIHAPAGLDLGRITHEEMAVAVIAEIVKLKAASGSVGGSGAQGVGAETATEDRASGATREAPVGSAAVGNGSPKEKRPATAQSLAGSAAPAAGADAPAEGSAEAIDPVCGMKVMVKGARYHSEHEGRTYYFCCPACRKRFEKNPQEYLSVKQQA